MENQIEKTHFYYQEIFQLTNKLYLVWEKLRVWENLHHCGILCNSVLLLSYTKGAGIVLKFFIHRIVQEIEIELLASKLAKIFTF